MIQVERKAKPAALEKTSTRGKNKLAEMLELVNSGESCILLGTQMLAKGHHFPNITLVAIMDADAGLFSADFRMCLRVRYRPRRRS